MIHILKREIEILRRRMSYVLKVTQKRWPGFKPRQAGSRAPALQLCVRGQMVNVLGFVGI